MPKNVPRIHSVLKAVDAYAGRGSDRRGSLADFSEIMMTDEDVLRPLFGIHRHLPFSAVPPNPAGWAVDIAKSSVEVLDATRPIVRAFKSDLATKAGCRGIHNLAC